MARDCWCNVPVWTLRPFALVCKKTTKGGENILLTFQGTGTQYTSKRKLANERVKGNVIKLAG